MSDLTARVAAARKALARGPVAVIAYLTGRSEADVIRVSGEPCNCIPGVPHFQDCAPASPASAGRAE